MEEIVRKGRKKQEEGRKSGRDSKKGKEEKEGREEQSELQTREVHICLPSAMAFARIFPANLK